MSQEEINQIFSLVAQGASWVVFLYLYLRERKTSHDIRKEHIADLREIANLQRKETNGS